MRFEWDSKKDRANRERRGLSFQEAAELFGAGVTYLTIYDDEHSDQEDRFIAIGPIKRGVIVVAYTERDDDVIRIFSARMATKKERQRLEQAYAEGCEPRDS